MRPSVERAFLGYTGPLEGRVTHFYLDTKGLVTIAFGNLVDPLSYALSLPMRRPDGSRATRDEIAADWTRIKNDASLARLGHRAAARVARLRLDDDGISLVVAGKLEQVDAQLAARFDGWPTWPADAQLATLSLAWACGAGFRFPRLETAARALDFATCALECTISEDGGNASLHRRNIAQRTLYRNAARVVRDGLDRDVLFWPRDLASEEETVPELPTEPRSSGPVIELDGGLARESATSEAIADAAHDEVTRRRS